MTHHQKVVAMNKETLLEGQIRADVAETEADNSYETSQEAQKHRKLKIKNWGPNLPTLKSLVKEYWLKIPKS